MPLEDDDQRRVDAATNEVGTDQSGTRLLVLNASETQKLGFWTVLLTVVNRSIGKGAFIYFTYVNSIILMQCTPGSGIFVTPAILLKATGSPGASLLIWALGAVSSVCALMVWLEFAFSIPKFTLPNRNEDGSLAEGECLQCVPRSGGEKNYLEYVYGSTRFRKLRTTCIYGFIYITLGNLSGNAIAFGTYILQAAGVSEGQDSLARGLAVVCMTSACLLHATSRQGGIYFINAVAMFKICILLTIIVIGFAAFAGGTFGYGSVHGETIINSSNQSGPANLAVGTSFAYGRKDFASYANSILFVIYTYSGTEQPFYVCTSSPDLS